MGNGMGHRLIVSEDPPSINAMAPLTTNVRENIAIPASLTHVIRTSDLHTFIKNSFNLDDATYSVRLNQAKVWILAPGTQLRVKFRDPFDGGIAAEIHDFGTPVKFPAVGYQYPNRVKEMALSGTDNVALLDVTHNDTEGTLSALVQFNVRIQFHTVPGGE